MTRPKRKAPDTGESATSRRSKRHAMISSRTHQEPAAERRKTPKRPDVYKKAVKKEAKRPSVNVHRKRKAEPKVVDPSSNTHPAATFKTPKNPQATFEGIPAELRVMIYEFASQSTMIHVHMHLEDYKPFTGIHDLANAVLKFSWTPCRGTNPKSPLLCANPKWSAMCKEEDRCTHKLTAPPEPRGFWALIASNKVIRREAKAPCLRNTVISIGPYELGRWFCHLVEYAPSHIEQIRRITIAGPDIYHIADFGMKTLKNCFASIESVGYQCFSPFRRWTKHRRNGQWVISNHAWRDWAGLDLNAHFDPSVDFVFEALVWLDPKELLPFKPVGPEHMTAVRVFGRGTKDVYDIEMLRDMDLAWKTETLDCSPLPVPQRGALWRNWWRTKEVETFFYW
ncbi:uncharacterized protein yc1106_02361 [Curvularia clavata]|uniref:Uncharacterized protein n=1 Tax=Curvularia clavata TaxID=95742 RepID=A0A9Q8Z2N9_CURCL|nr:uncharacterized protein yc1106_02361 [Curvularia clavata]